MTCSGTAHVVEELVIATATTAVITLLGPGLAQILKQRVLLDGKSEILKIWLFNEMEPINPLSPGVKLQILLLCFHTFLREVVERSC